MGTQMIIWIHIECENRPEKFPLEMENDNLDLDHLANMLCAGEILEKFKPQDITFFTYDDRINPISMDILLKDLNTTARKPIVVRKTFSSSRVHVRCLLSKKEHARWYENTSGIWYLLRNDIENTWKEKKLDIIDYWFVPTTDIASNMKSDRELFNFIQSIVCDGKSEVNLSVKFKDRKPYSEWKLKDVLGNILLHTGDLNQLEKFHIDIDKSYIEEEDIRKFVDALKQKHRVFKTVNDKEATVREFVSIFFTFAVDIIQRKENTDIRLHVEKEIEGSRGYGPVDYAFTFEVIVRALSESEKTDIEQGIAQNLMQLLSALEELEDNRKRKYDEDSPKVRAVVHGIVSTAVKWYFIELEDSKNPKARLSKLYYTLDYEENMESNIEILHIITNVLRKHVRKGLGEGFSAAFGEHQRNAFQAIKAVLLSKIILTHYNPKLKLVITTDASPVGVSGVLSHRFPDGTEKPVAFASRTLTQSERNYSQIDREALAIVFSVNYFHQYVYGLKFVLRTDNKALSFIFHENKEIPVMSAQRVQRYAVFLAAYHYTIEHVKGSEIPHVDALSRLPIPCTDEINHEESDNFYSNAIFESVETLALVDLAEHVTNDKILRDIFIRVYFDTWPEQESELSDELKVYLS